MAETRITFCRLCEATCGLEVDVEANRVVEIRPDPLHVVSRGYACVKGTRYAETQHSPDRVLSPQKRTAGGWQEIGWDAALREIAARIRAEVARNGPNTVAHFAGSPAGANVLSPLFRGALWKALGSTRMYGTGSCDTMNKFRVNEDMYGSPMRLAHPDVDRTQFMLVLGANPAVSGNTLYSHKIGHLHFWSIVAFYSTPGAHHLMGAPIPEWLKSFASVSGVLIMIPALAFVVNMLMTMKDKW